MIQGYTLFTLDMPLTINNYETTCQLTLIHFQLHIKRIVHKNVLKIPYFTHPPAILGLYDFLLSDKSNPS